MPETKKHRKHSPQRSVPSGWLTSDADEIERRRVRGLNEPSRIKSYGQEDDFFDVYRIDSNTGQSYRVEIRSLSEHLNTCDCPDHRINSLGTCKHIEATLIRLQYRRKRAFRKAAVKGSPFIEVFLDRLASRSGYSGPRPANTVPKPGMFSHLFSPTITSWQESPSTYCPPCNGQLTRLTRLAVAESSFQEN